MLCTIVALWLRSRSNYLCWERVSLDPPNGRVKYHISLRDGAIELERFRVCEPPPRRHHDWERDTWKLGWYAEDSERSHLRPFHPVRWFSLDNATGLMPPGYEYVVLSVPVWFLCALLAVPPAWRILGLHHCRRFR